MPSAVIDGSGWAASDVPCNGSVQAGGHPVSGTRQLLWRDKPSDSPTTLWRHGRLDLTVEAAVLCEDFSCLLTDADRQEARERLELYGWPGRP